MSLGSRNSRSPFHGQPWVAQRDTPGTWEEGVILGHFHSLDNRLRPPSPAALCVFPWTLAPQEPPTEATSPPGAAHVPPLAQIKA